MYRLGCHSLDFLIIRIINLKSFSWYSKLKSCCFGSFHCRNEPLTYSGLPQEIVYPQ